MTRPTRRERPRVRRPAGAPSPRLEVYVMPGCIACDAAIAVATRARRAFPGVAVEVVDLGERGAAPPDAVFAVPTFTLDGRVVSLGTPRWEDLQAALVAVSRAGRAGRAGGEEDAR